MFFRRKFLEPNCYTHSITSRTLVQYFITHHKDFRLNKFFQKIQLLPFKQFDSANFPKHNCK